MTQYHLIYLYGTYLCRVVQNESKEHGISSLHWIAYEIQLLLLESNGWPLSANYLYLQMVEEGMWVNDACTTIIFLERGTFSALFNTKTNIVWWIVCFLHTVKETACVRRFVVRVTKKWIWKQSSMFVLSFDQSYGASPHTGPFPRRLLVVTYPEERGWQFHSVRDLLTTTQTFFNHLPGSQFHETFDDKWPGCMQKCILSRGSYFEKDQSKNEDIGSDSE